MQNTGRPCPSMLTDARILDALVSYLAAKNEVGIMKVLHLTCRTAAGAINSALRQLSLNGKLVQLMSTVFYFPALESLHLKQCLVLSQVCISDVVSIKPKN